MKKKNPVWNSIGILVGVVILILALTENTPRTVLLSAAATVWMLWLALVLLATTEPPKQTRRRKHPKRPAFDYKAPTTEQLLLCHVNHRISARLSAVQPDASWEWCVKDPVRLIQSGGTGRIRVFGISGYDYADIRIDRHANLGCNLVQMLPLDQENADTVEPEKLPPNREPVNPRIWYEQEGRELLERLVADLNSRGHSSLTITGDGDVCIRTCGSAEDVSVERFASFPEKAEWPGLVQVLEGEGLAADATAQGIQVTW